MILLSPAFIAAHPLRIDLRDGTHLRFRDLWGAAASAVERNRPIWDEERQQKIELQECRQIAAAASKAREE